MKHVHETCGNKKDKYNSNNKYVEFLDDEEKKRMKNNIRC